MPVSPKVRFAIGVALGFLFGYPLQMGVTLLVVAVFVPLFHFDLIETGWIREADFKFLVPVLSLQFLPIAAVAYWIRRRRPAFGSGIFLWLILNGGFFAVWYFVDVIWR